MNDTTTAAAEFSMALTIMMIMSVVFVVTAAIAIMGFKFFPRIAVNPPWFFDRNSKNFLGRFIGFGQCKRCGDTWNWKKTHITEFDTDDGKVRGVFALCEECWQELAVPDRRIDFYHKHIDEVSKMSPPHVKVRIEQEDRKLVEHAVFNGR
jgi:hypothetical protein